MNNNHLIAISSTLKSGLNFEMNVTQNMKMTQELDQFATLDTVVLMLLEIVNTHFTFANLLSAMNIIVVLPSNLLTFIVIVVNKDLWTASNVVLSINSLVQAVGSVIYLFARSLSLHALFFVVSDTDYKETLYQVCWWTYAIMVRVGNNRRVNNM